MKLTNHAQKPPVHKRLFQVAFVTIIVGGWLLAGCGGASTPDTLPVEPSPAPTSTAMPATAAQVEDRYGVQVTLVALTAANGLIDCRFRITDLAKAAFLLNADTMPLLIVEKSNTVIQIHEPIDQPALIQDRVYSVIYPNVQNALEPGDQVSLVIGDLRLEHILVQ
jgi:hypothetical protein